MEYIDTFQEFRALPIKHCISEENYFTFSSPTAAIVVLEGSLKHPQPFAQSFLDEPVNVGLGFLLLRVVRLREATSMKHQTT